MVLLLAGVASAQEDDGWVKFSDRLLEQVPEHSLIQRGARRVGGLAVDRLNGDLYVCLNGWPFGVWKSTDAGETYERIDKGHVVGGWVRSYSISLDQEQSGRMAFFRIFPPPSRRYLKEKDPFKQNSSAMTIDGGETWREFELFRQPYGGGGWQHGMVDWSDPEGLILIGNDRRGKINVSRDGGESWDALPKNSFHGVLEGSLSRQRAKALEEKHPNMAPRISYPTTRGYAISGDAIMVGDAEGIHRSLDAGENWEKVSDYEVAGYTPIQLGGKLYWAAEKGIIVSEDGGKTWALQGQELPGACQGPLFGKDESTMVVVTPDGVFKTTDACQSWTKISELKFIEDSHQAEFGLHLRRHDYAWDPHRDILYVAGLASSAYKKQLSVEGGDQ
jgi:photosystem II stability/assembly factor-like uncharacterized protein